MESVVIYGVIYYCIIMYLFIVLNIDVLYVMCYKRRIMVAFLFRYLILFCDIISLELIMIVLITFYEVVVVVQCLFISRLISRNTICYMNSGTVEHINQRGNIYIFINQIVIPKIKFEPKSLL